MFALSALNATTWGNGIHMQTMERDMRLYLIRQY
jgi:hypothetical protein